jgi:hypothetical protein
MVSLPHESAEELHLDAAVTNRQELANHLLLLSIQIAYEILNMGLQKALYFYIR